ncbi:MAG: response regulator transcription factor [Bacillota bacterium]|nr:response regulator transcription factor [Bacillota bacterium]MDW7683941.1 response regulator transcription factor [Bacillota bacterium]
MTSEKKIRVVIADDHALIRDGLRKILAMHGDLDVVAEAPDGQAAYEMAATLSPDVILMDINMPNMNGIEATRRIKQEFPKTGVIALTIHDDEEYIYELIKVGVSAYVLKDIESDFLINTIRAVSRGETVYHPKIAEKMCGEFQRIAMRSVHEESLSRREVDVLVLIARGKSNKEIGSELYISEKTVKNHITNIFRKIRVTDRTQAALYAVKNRLVKI